MIHGLARADRRTALGRVASPLTLGTRETILLVAIRSADEEAHHWGMNWPLSALIRPSLRGCPHHQVEPGARARHTAACTGDASPVADSAAGPSSTRVPVQRETDSATAQESLLDCPFVWVMQSRHGCARGASRTPPGQSSNRPACASPRPGVAVAGAPPPPTNSPIRLRRTCPAACGLFSTGRGRGARGLCAARGAGRGRRPGWAILPAGRQGAAAGDTILADMDQWRERFQRRAAQ